MLASELKKLSDSYNAAPKEVSVEVMTVLKNAANAGKYSVSFRELCITDQNLLTKSGFKVKHNPDWLDFNYVVSWK